MFGIDHRVYFRAVVFAVCSVGVSGVPCTAANDGVVPCAASTNGVDQPEPAAEPDGLPSLPSFDDPSPFSD